MIIAKKIAGSFSLPLAALAILFLVIGCTSSNAGTQLRSLEDEINSLKSNVSTLKNDLDEMQVKNKALESEIQTLKSDINSLKITSH